MEIAMIVLIAIGLVAGVGTLFFSADLFVPQCPVCSEELEADVSDDWLWLCGEGYVGWIPRPARCPRCERLSAQSRKSPVNANSAVTPLT